MIGGIDGTNALSRGEVGVVLQTRHSSRRTKREGPPRVTGGRNLGHPGPELGMRRVAALVKLVAAQWATTPSDSELYSESPQIAAQNRGDRRALQVAETSATPAPNSAWAEWPPWSMSVEARSAKTQSYTIARLLLPSPTVNSNVVGR